MKQLVLFVLLSFVLVGISRTSGASAGTSLKRSASTSASTPASRGWGGQRTENFARLLCEDKHYFRTCFSLKRSECESAVRNETRICHGRLKTVNSREPANETRMAAKIGICVGTALEKKWLSRKSAATKCDQPESWR